jgi:hypothetical protein
LLEKEIQMQLKNQEDFIARFDKTLDRLSEFTASLKDLLISHDSRISSQAEMIKAIYKDVDSDITELKKSNSRIEKRLGDIEKFIWVAVGVATVVSILIQKISLVSLFS